MITPSTIRGAVVSKLRAVFPTTPVISQDVEKGFVQPSFTVRFEDYQPEQIQESLEQAMNIRIFYFPNFDDPDMSVEVMDKTFEIPRAFGNKLYVADRALNINEPDVIEIDGILEYSFNLLFEQYDAENDAEAHPDAEVMQDLYIQIKKEGC